MTAAQLRERFLARPGGSHDGDLRTLLSENGIGEVLSYVAVLSYPPDAPGSALNGREVYRRYCVSCHGTEGDGNGPAAGLLVTKPTDFSRDTLVARRDFERLISRTRDGPDGAHASSMPAWGLFFDDRMLWDVALYLPTFQPSVGSRPPN
jgi:mono/diheme cytochrome c family protein